jgi:hypothetical protein
VPGTVSVGRRAGIDETPARGRRRDLAVPAIAEEDPWPYSDSVHVDFLHSFTEDDVWEVLDRLKPMYRVPLVLVHMEGMTTRGVRMLERRSTRCCRGCTAAGSTSNGVVGVRRALTASSRGERRRTMIAAPKPCVSSGSTSRTSWTGDDRSRIEEHLTFCRRCCGEMEFAEMNRFMASVEDRPLPPGGRSPVRSVRSRAELETEGTP